MNWIKYNNSSIDILTPALKLKLWQSSNYLASKPPIPHTYITELTFWRCSRLYFLIGNSHRMCHNKKYFIAQQIVHVFSKLPLPWCKTMDNILHILVLTCQKESNVNLSFALEKCPYRFSTGTFWSYSRFCAFFPLS